MKWLPEFPHLYQAEKSRHAEFTKNSNLSFQRAGCSFVSRHIPLGGAYAIDTLNGIQFQIHRAKNDILNCLRTATKAGCDV